MGARSIEQSLLNAILLGLPTPPPTNSPEPAYLRPGHLVPPLQIFDWLQATTTRPPTSPLPWA